jgi:hypothetical protein
LADRLTEAEDRSGGHLRKGWWMLWVIITISLSSFTFEAGRRWERLRTWAPFPDHLEDRSKFDDQFERVRASWESYVKASDGFLPFDPYRALIDGGFLQSYMEFGDIRFDPCLPPRINPKIKLNRREVIFRETIPLLSEEWTYNADGTTERHAMSSNSDVYHWCRLKAIAGLPSWQSAEDRSKWLEDNRQLLIWSSEKGLFVVAGSPSTSTGR